jgi:electron transport complex protein RnfE
MMLMIHVVTVIIGRMFTLGLYLWQRVAINVTISTAIMLVSRELVIMMFPAIMNSVGMYLYLMAVNGLTLTQANARPGPRKLMPVLTRTLVEVCAFAGLMFIISFVREYLGNGTLWGVPVPVPFRQAGILYPFYGFIFTGFLLAFLRKVNKVLLAVRINDAERRESVYIST